MATLTSFNRGIYDLKLATWTAAASYGTAYDILGARQANLTWQVESDEARGDDAVLDRYSSVVAAQVTIAQATVDLIVANKILGGTLVGGAEYYDLMVDNIITPPYVAIAGRVRGSGGAGDFQFFIPKAKISGSPQFNAQVDTYLFPQLQLQGVYEGTVNGIMRFRHFFLPTTLTIPLATAHD